MEEPWTSPLRPQAAARLRLPGCTSGDLRALRGVQEREPVLSTSSGQSLGLGISIGLEPSQKAKEATACPPLNSKQRAEENLPWQVFVFQPL